MRSIKLIVFPLLFLFIVGFVLFLIAQIANLVYLADRIDPLFGDVVLFSLITLVSILFLIPLYTYLSLPKAILPPQSDNGEAVEAYQRALISRYNRNRTIKQNGLVINNIEDVKKGVKILDGQADKIIQYNTVRTFAGTAISQTGTFDSLIVFYFAMNTIWRVSRIYYQRTTFRQLVSLYSNIGLMVIGAKLLEDQLDEYLEENIDEFVHELAEQGAETTASIGAKATKIIPGLGSVVESLCRGLLMD